MSTSKLQISTLVSPNTVHTGVLQPIGSKSFIKKLIPAAIATILNRRTNFDDTTYTNHQLCGVKYSMFNHNNRNSTVIDIRCWIKGALHAFEKNYLRELYLVFMKADNSTDVIESYKFKFNYFLEGEKTPITRDRLEQATTSLLQSINDLNVYDLLQTDQFAPVIMLTYNKETPNEYEPPFHHTESVTASKILNQISGGVNSFVYLGHILTGFHSMKCRVKGSHLVPIDSESNYTSDVDDRIDEVDRDQHTTDNKMKVEETFSTETTSDGVLLLFTTK
ncbi:hypothetical protein RI129_001478 [Pyrocoelia pectoralis]|uniref:HORMA domain-containing protein n=1 Tax=Pyrocoelia pectoralis TaxID=417401 RepID=A0AAN7VYE5_9COLE